MAPPYVDPMREKRAAAIAAKEEKAPVKLNFADKVPAGFKPRVPPPPPSEEEAARLANLYRRRAFAYEARRVFRLADADNNKFLEFHELARHGGRSWEINRDRVPTKSG